MDAVTQLEGLDFAGDIAALSHTEDQRQDKLSILDGKLQQPSLNIHWGKTKIIKANQTNYNPIFLGVMVTHFSLV